MEKHALYQDVDLLPVALEKSHFEEGLIYAMTLEENHEKTLLVMVIEVQEETFVYRLFFSQKSARKTYHEGAADTTCPYSEV